MKTTGRRRIGLTGGIASGKSTAAARLAELGAVIIDSDVLAREVVAPGTQGLADLVRRFGGGVLADDGSLDRAALGRLVFADEAARSDLEAIIHPAVRARSAQLRESAAPGACVVEVIPLLVETGQASDFDELLVVDLPEDEQVERLMNRSGLSREEALARLAAQASREDRLAAATRVLDNSGTEQELRRQVDAWWGEVHPSW